jgi:serpin B
MFDKAAILEEEKIVYLNYNQPFMFVIRDSKTNEVWFLGTVYNPIEWEDIKGEYNYK